MASSQTKKKNQPNLSVATESLDETKKNLKEEILCNICFDTVAPTNVVNTACKHTFCSECFFEWMKNKYTCPCCRKLLITREMDQQVALADNAATINLQEESISSNCEEIADLRRLNRIHRRRNKNLVKDNTNQMGRQLRVRKMVDDTRAILKKIERKKRKIQDFIANNSAMTQILIHENPEAALRTVKKEVARVLSKKRKEHRMRMKKVMAELLIGFIAFNSRPFPGKYKDLISGNIHRVDIDSLYDAESYCDMGESIRELFSEAPYMNKRRIVTLSSSEERIPQRVQRRRIQSPFSLPDVEALRRLNFRPVNRPAEFRRELTNFVVEARSPTLNAFSGVIPTRFPTLNAFSSLDIPAFSPVPSSGDMFVFRAGEPVHGRRQVSLPSEVIKSVLSEVIERVTQENI